MSGEELYSARVAALFRAAPAAGRPAGPGWVSGEAREPLSATHVRWHLRCLDGRVVGACYEVRGCPHTVAAAALVATDLIGRPITELGVDLEQVAAELGAPSAKLGRFFVIQDAIQAAALQL
jgi:hypothetical protein